MLVVEVRLVNPDIPADPTVPIFSRVTSLSLTVVKEDKGVIAPMVPLTLILPPPALRESVCAPSMVLEKMILPLAATELRFVAPIKVTGAAKEIAPIVVVMFDPSETAPAPF